MQIIEVQFALWDQSYYFKPENTTGKALELKKNDEVIVETSIGIDIGKVIQKGELAENSDDSREIKPIIRQATDEDKLKNLELNKDSKELLEFCRKIVKRLNLEMKLVDAHVSFDNKRLVYAFIADGRIDFRDLVKELTKKYQRVIRLQQIGVRDEAKISGDFGTCGRTLCCKSHLAELGNVSTEYVKTQQVTHRGADRLSGVCNRLKCCLRYEQPLYEELLKKFPEVGSKIKTKMGNGVVYSRHILKGTIDVNIGTKEERQMVEVDV